MKPQDILFFLVYVALFFVGRPRLFIWMGLTCLVAAIPLFITWTFFTAERLTWYAALSIATYILISSRTATVRDSLSKPHRVQ